MFAVSRNISSCVDLSNRVANENRTTTTGISPSVELAEAVLLIGGFGFFAALLASGFKIIRSRIYLDKVSKVVCDCFICMMSKWTVDSFLSGRFRYAVHDNFMFFSLII